MAKIMRDVLALMCVLLAQLSFGQSENSAIRKGNKLYTDTAYSAAEQEYLSALEENPESQKAQYNLANTYYRQGKYKEAVQLYNQALKNGQKVLKDDDLFYNRGNAEMKDGKAEAAINSYKSALRLNYQNMDAQHNLKLAKAMLQQQQQQQKQDGDQGEDGEKGDKNKEQQKDQDQNKDGEGEGDQKDEKNRDSDQKNKGENGKDNEEQNKEKQDDKGKSEQEEKKGEEEIQQQGQELTKDQAEQLLKALETDEQGVREKMIKQELKKKNQQKSDKDW